MQCVSSVNQKKATHLLRTNFYLIVGCGDDDVLGGEVSHIHCELVRIPKSFNVSRSTWKDEMDVIWP